MEKTDKNQSCSSLCFSRTSLLCVSVLVPFLVVIYFLSFGFSPFFVTILLLVLSTVFIVKFKKKKVILDENQIQDEGLTLIEKEVGGAVQPLTETAAQTGAAQQIEVHHQQHEYQVESLPDMPFPSDSESSNESMVDENFELNWMCSNNVGQDVAISDGSVSDEEDDGLIEIALPGGSNEEPEQKPRSNLPDFLTESILQEQGLMELLSEINENEEENLIEIDLSNGFHSSVQG